MCCIFLDISFKEACLLISLRPKIKTTKKKIPLSGIHNSQNKKERKKYKKPTFDCKAALTGIYFFTRTLPSEKDKT